MSVSFVLEHWQGAEGDGHLGEFASPAELYAFAVPYARERGWAECLYPEAWPTGEGQAIPGWTVPLGRHGKFLILRMVT